MQIVEQTLKDITGALTTLEAPWQDEHAAKVIALVQSIPLKETYGPDDVGAMFDESFDTAFTAAYLFLGVSKDEFQDRLAKVLPGQAGVTRFKRDRTAFLKALDELDLPAAMSTAVNFKPSWSDILIERLRSGRGKA